MKILITGSEGYVGKHLIKFLENKKKIKIYKLDIKDKNNPIDINRKINFNKTFDCIVHLAGLVSVSESIKNPEKYYETNLFGTINLINSVKFRNFIFASTSGAEKQENPYARSKRCAEDIIKKYCKNYTIFRFYNVIGCDGFEPTNQDGLFYNLLKTEKTGEFKIFGNDYNTKDGTCIRDYIHITEICHCIYKAIRKSTNNIENLGHGKGWTVKEIVETFKKVNNSNFKVKIYPKREGDIEFIISKNISKYMKTNFSLEKMLKK